MCRVLSATSDLHQVRAGFRVKPGFRGDQPCCCLTAVQGRTEPIGHQLVQFTQRPVPVRDSESCHIAEGARSSLSVRGELDQQCPQHLCGLLEALRAQTAQVDRRQPHQQH